MKRWLLLLPLLWALAWVLGGGAEPARRGEPTVAGRATPGARALEIPGSAGTSVSAVFALSGSFHGFLPLAPQVAAVWGTPLATEAPAWELGDDVVAVNLDEPAAPVTFAEEEEERSDQDPPDRRALAAATGAWDLSGGELEQSGAALRGAADPTAQSLDEARHHSPRAPPFRG